MRAARRKCDGCTECCMGVLTLTAFGQPVFQGRPCIAVEAGKGCTRWKDPEKPRICDDFRCGWLDDETIPVWMKPNSSGAILRFGTLVGHDYVELLQADLARPVSTKALSWFIMWGLARTGNIRWQLDGGWNYLGHPEFSEACARMLPSSDDFVEAIRN